MPRKLNKFFTNSAVLATIAIIAGVGVMGLLFLTFEGGFEKSRPGSEAVSELSADALVQPVHSEIFTLHVRSVPAPFVDKNGEPKGYVFLDFMLEVAGEGTRDKAGAALDELVLDFTRDIAEAGAGQAAHPGIVDYDRLARTFLTLAQKKIGNDGIVRVIVLESKDG